MDYFSLLDDDTLSIVLQYVIEFNDFLLTFDLGLMYTNIGKILSTNDKKAYEIIRNNSL